MMAVSKARILSSSFLGPSPDDGPPVGLLDFEGNVDGVGQQKKNIKNKTNQKHKMYVGFFSKGAGCL